MKFKDMPFGIPFLISWGHIEYEIIKFDDNTHCERNIKFYHWVEGLYSSEPLAIYSLFTVVDWFEDSQSSSSATLSQEPELRGLAGWLPQDSFNFDFSYYGHVVEPIYYTIKKEPCICFGSRSRSCNAHDG
jgi:hypothetical protein